MMRFTKNLLLGANIFLFNNFLGPRFFFGGGGGN